MAGNRDRSARESSLAKGWIVEADDQVEEVSTPLDAPELEVDSPDEPEAADQASPERAQLSNGAMVLLGVVGGLYLAYTWVWFSWAQYAATATGASLSLTSGSVGAVLQLVLYWIAPLAPVLWFVSALLLNRGGSALRLGLWLGIGAVVLVPLPYFLWGS